MSANQFGENFSITTFGESHGVGLGVVIDGCPSGIDFDQNLLNDFLDRRRPGQSGFVSPRKEKDKVEILSGVYQGKTLGTPIAMMVRNHDAKSDDYKSIVADVIKKPRIGHADDVWNDKFTHVDLRGGGRSSGRETLCRVLGGAVAQMFMQSAKKDIAVKGYVQAVDSIELTNEEENSINEKTNIEEFSLRLPSKEKNKKAEALLIKGQGESNSYSGNIGLKVFNCPKGLGQPIFHKLKSDLTSAIMSIGAVRGIEFGSSQVMDGKEFHSSIDSPVYGGIRGGISTGESIYLKVFFKPTSSINDVAKKGRHDPCIVIRAVAVVEAMVWLVLADHLLWARQDNIEGL